mgnify:CR=1 FL=1
MSLTFNADEILEIAQRIETNGMNFYSTAAEVVSEPEARELLSGLAEWEVQHEKLFSEWRAALTPEEKQPTVFDPDNEIGLYLAATADKVVFTSKMQPEEMFGGDPSYKHILELALERERDAVVFYAATRDLVPTAQGRDKIDALMKEEVSHVALIQQRLRELG